MAPKLYSEVLPGIFLPLSHPLSKQPEAAWRLLLPLEPFPSAYLSWKPVVVSMN